MSHFFSFAAVTLLFTSIVFNIISLSVVWWTVAETPANEAIRMDAGFYSVKFASVHAGMSREGAAKSRPWDEVCQAPELGADIRSLCPMIEAGRAFVLCGCVFAFIASLGNAAGIYTGNTLIDSAAGIVAAFSAICSGLSIAVGFIIQPEGLTSSPGFMMTCLATGQQFVGGLCGCIGTCQEMRDMAKLAASLQIGEFKEVEKELPRSQVCAKIREGEAAENDMICKNLAKRKRQAEAAAMNIVSTREDDPDEKVVKKIPIMLKRVLFRKPVDGDDDEIPTKMLEDAFAEIDGDGSGSIELEELVDSLTLCGLAVSKVATDTIMKEIDKNASGDVDLREFIEFFRHIEDLNRFGKKSAARKQFLSFLLNFCFLADIVVVGVMLMMFIRMDQAENPDTYSIMKNVLTACSFLLGVLFLVVILLPILRLAFGPTIDRMQKQYELAQEIKKAAKNRIPEVFDDEGPREVGYSADDPPPPVNAAMFGRSYRPGKVESAAWAPAIEDLPQNGKVPGSGASQSGSGGGSHSASGGGHTQSGSATASGHGSGAKDDTTGQSVKVHGHGKNWRYDPGNYSIASEHANMMSAAGLGPTSWTPMQVQDVAQPKQTAPSILPGIPLALTDAAFPQPRGHNTRIKGAPEPPPDNYLT